MAASSPTEADSLRPSMAEYRVDRVRQLTNLIQLVSAKEINKLSIVAEIKPDMSLPACGIVARQYSNTTVGRAFKGDTPIEPGPCQCRSSTANPDACQAPVNEGGTPGNFVVVANEIGLVVVLDYPRVRLASRKTSDATFGNRHGHPSGFSDAISDIYDHSRWRVSCAYRDCRRFDPRGRPSQHGRQATIVFAVDVGLQTPPAYAELYYFVSRSIVLSRTLSFVRSDL